MGYIHDGVITKEDFLKAPSFESITRARRKVQELNPELAPNDYVKKAREKIEAQKGTHIFREEVAINNRDSLIEDIVSM